MRCEKGSVRGETTVLCQLDGLGPQVLSWQPTLGIENSVEAPAEDNAGQTHSTAQTPRFLTQPGS